MSVESQPAVQVPVVSETTSGKIEVRNDGAYVARFSVSYKPGTGRRKEKKSGKFPAGTMKSVAIPSDATDIRLKWKRTQEPPGRPSSPRTSPSR